MVLREEKGLTQEQLAWAAGVDKGYLSRVEAGRRTPSLAILEAVGDELGVPAWLMLSSLPDTPRGRLLRLASLLEDSRVDEALRRLETDLISNEEPDHVG